MGWRLDGRIRVVAAAMASTHPEVRLSLGRFAGGAAGGSLSRDQVVEFGLRYCSAHGFQCCWFRR